MEQEIEAPRSPVWVSFKKSSTKDGGEGFEISVGEGADATEAQRLMYLALQLRDQALAALKGKDLSEQLASSIKQEAVTPEEREQAVDQAIATIENGARRK